MQHPRKFIALAALGVLCIVARAGLADTITLHDYAPGTNPAAGIYEYTVSLDNAANVQKGDGFVMYDWEGLTSYSFGGPLAGLFSLTTTLNGDVLNQPNSVQANELVLAAANNIVPDDPTLPNLNFIYNGSNSLLGPVTDMLTLTTSVRPLSTIDLYVSIDHSGPTMGVPYSFSANPITVPSVPAPEAFLTGGLLFGFIGLAQWRKSRLV